MNIKKILYKALEDSFLHNDYSFDDISLTFSNRPEEADFQCNSAFSIAKKVHTSPEVVANAIIANLNQDVADVWFSKPGFINFKIKDEVLSKMMSEALSDDRLCLAELDEKETVVSCSCSNPLYDWIIPFQQ